VEQLVDTVIAMSALTGKETVLDAYCGSGLFSMFLAPAARRIFGVELWEKAITCARENLVRAGFENAVFFSGDMGSILEREFIVPRRHLDVLVIDPPREGCKDLFFPSKTFRPKRIVYVSCHPATQARDCRFFADHGYTLQSVQPFDMFPQTSHIEVVALLLTQE
jgi:23S rRNA (uracil1939-C5)-methyltransferase